MSAPTIHADSLKSTPFFNLSCDNCCVFHPNEPLERSSNGVMLSSEIRSSNGDFHGNRLNRNCVRQNSGDSGRHGSDNIEAADRPLEAFKATIRPSTANYHGGPASSATPPPQCPHGRLRSASLSATTASAACHGVIGAPGGVSADVDAIRRRNTRKNSRSCDISSGIFGSGPVLVSPVTGSADWTSVYCDVGVVHSATSSIHRGGQSQLDRFEFLKSAESKTLTSAGGSAPLPKLSEQPRFLERRVSESAAMPIRGTSNAGGSAGVSRTTRAGESFNSRQSVFEWAAETRIKQRQQRQKEVETASEQLAGGPKVVAGKGDV